MSARAVQLVLVGLTATILIAPLVWKGARRRLDIFEPIVIFTAAYGVMFVVRVTANGVVVISCNTPGVRL